MENYVPGKLKSELRCTMSFGVVQSSTSFPRYTLGSLPPTPDVALGTTTNIAYEMTKQGGQGGGQEGEHAYELMKLVGVPQWVERTCMKYRLPLPPSTLPPSTLPPSTQPLYPVKVERDGREMWCMRTFLETTLQGMCSVILHLTTLHRT